VTLVLASRSPRRSEILKQAGISFEVRPAAVDETPLTGETPRRHVERLAREKAFAVEARPGEIVLGADTIVVVEGRILGKPADAAEAARMLESLSGRMHEVMTGVCLRQGDWSEAGCEVTRVWFAPLTVEEIAAYVSSGEPMDKAGAYAIQGLASKFIPRIEGSYSNVVGLPVEWVYARLRERKDVQ
jgi:septum formation protein